MNLAHFPSVLRDLCLLEAHTPKAGLVSPCQFPRTEWKEKPSHRDTHFCLLLIPFSPLNLFCVFKDHVKKLVLILNTFHKSLENTGKVRHVLGNGDLRSSRNHMTQQRPVPHRIPSFPWALLCASFADAADEAELTLETDMAEPQRADPTSPFPLCCDQPSWPFQAGELISCGQYQLLGLPRAFPFLVFTPNELRRF